MNILCLALPKLKARWINYARKFLTPLGVRAGCAHKMSAQLFWVKWQDEDDDEHG